jgi:hypothetical protein
MAGLDGPVDLILRSEATKDLRLDRRRTKSWAMPIEPKILRLAQDKLTTR